MLAVSQKWVNPAKNNQQTASFFMVDVIEYHGLVYETTLIIQSFMPVAWLVEHPFDVNKLFFVSISLANY